MDISKRQFSTLVQKALISGEMAVDPAPSAPATISLEAFEASEVPPSFTATEVKVYAVPLLNPVTMHEVAGTVTVQLAPPGEAVTM